MQVQFLGQEDPHLVSLPEKSQGQRSPAGHSLGWSQIWLSDRVDTQLAFTLFPSTMIYTLRVWRIVFGWLGWLQQLGYIPGIYDVESSDSKNLAIARQVCVCVRIYTMSQSKCQEHQCWNIPIILLYQCAFYVSTQACAISELLIEPLIVLFSILLYLNSLISSLKIWWNFQLGFRNVFHEHFI